MREKNKHRGDMVSCFVAKNEGDILKCLEVRQEVFVEEQGLFKESDQDSFDKKAFHIAAKIKNTIIGTVRVFEKEDRIWFGGRLAILKGDRHGYVAKMLVRKAVEIAKENKARRFLAWVQEQNINFFLRLRWRKKGKPQLHMGKIHQLMEADLKE